IISSSLSYMGRATTFLSMLVLGVSVAQIAPKEIFSHPKLYAFALIRQILLPIGVTLMLRLFIPNSLLVNTTALMLAVPAGNMPLMLSKQLHVDESTISQGIILTTILSLVTIPLVTLFIA
ncbi:MAG: AEC family transporter, partial [Lachnospiraceae bacterium]|nr:AEC family transporter [Lachnospiraceae bacterium]